MPKSLAEQPAIKQFLTQTLPGREGGHVLTFGDNHRYAEHLDYLRAHLGELKETHNVAALGLERAPYLNSFYWAYRDGRLPAGCETPAQAQHYLRALSRAMRNTAYAQSADALADLAIATVDQGLALVHFDARKLLGERLETYAAELAQLDTALTREAAMQHLSVPELEARLRTDDSARTSLLAHSGIAPADAPYSWVLRECSTLLAANPDYQAQVGAMEQILREGKKRGIGQDAMSATLLHAMAPSHGNTVSLNGFTHLDEIADPDHESLGTFSVHLEQLKADGAAAPKVHEAVLGCAAMNRTIAQLHQAQLRAPDAPPIPLAGGGVLKGYDGPIVRSAPTPVIDLESGEISTLPHPAPDDPRLVSWEEHFPDHSHANPLLVPEIRRAVAHLQTLLHAAGNESPSPTR